MATLREKQLAIKILTERIERETRKKVVLKEASLSGIKQSDELFSQIESLYQREPWAGINPAPTFPLRLWPVA